jgi:PKD repeat protein
MASAITPADSTRRTAPKRLALVLAIVTAAILALGAAFFQAPAANAAPAAKGWVRVGHLSPDTKSVDVRLTSLAGGQVVYELDNVTYGQVSAYKQLPVGTYSVSMTAAGAAATSTPVISASITVASGKPITVVAYGRNADLKTTVFQDDLSKPAVDKARIRLVQAATVSKSVSVATSTGTQIAENAPYGSASGYASVGAGKWTLDVTGKKKATTSTASVNLASGSINTLFVLDNAKGGITIVPAVDSAATTITPKGGVQTGGGYEATHASFFGDTAEAATFAELAE